MHPKILPSFSLFYLKNASLFLLAPSLSTPFYFYFCSLFPIYLGGKLGVLGGQLTLSNTNISKLSCGLHASLHVSVNNTCTAKIMHYNNNIAFQTNVCSYMPYH